MILGSLGNVGGYIHLNNVNNREREREEIGDKRTEKGEKRDRKAANDEHTTHNTPSHSTTYYSASRTTPWYLKADDDDNKHEKEP